MRTWHIHSDDRRWLARWLRSNLTCATLIAGTLILLQVDSAVPVVPVTGAHAVAASASSSQAASPQGWRRTAQGWEHVSCWRIPTRPLGDLILMQRQREPAWVRAALRTLRELPPLTFAMLQLTAIAAIAFVSERAKENATRSL